MASWKKVIVSGSKAHLTSIGVGTADAPSTQGQISASGKLFASSSALSGLSSYNVVIKRSDGSGEFLHTSSAAISPTIQSLKTGSGILATAGDYVGTNDTTYFLDTASLAGNGLEAGSAGVIAAKAHTNIGVDSSGIRVDSGSLVDTAKGLSAALASNKISVATDGSTLGFNGSGQLTASFQAGADLTAGANIIISNDSGDTSGTNNVYDGSANRKVAVDSGSLAGLGLDTNANKIRVKGAASLTDGYLVKWDDGNGQFVNSTISQSSNTIHVGNGSSTVTVPGNLTVNGTASFTHATNLAIKDPFILLASGSSAGTDFGIVGEVGGNALDGIGWSYDNTNKRFGLFSGSSIPNGTLGSLQGHASLMVGSSTSGLDSDFQEVAGNMVIDSNQEIYIYS